VTIIDTFETWSDNILSNILSIFEIAVFCSKTPQASPSFSSGKCSMKREINTEHRWNNIDNDSYSKSRSKVRFMLHTDHYISYTIQLLHEVKVIVIVGSQNYMNPAYINILCEKSQRFLSYTHPTCLCVVDRDSSPLPVAQCFRLCVCVFL